MTDDEILARWLCAECYGRYVYRSYDHGVLSSSTSTLTANTTLTATYGDKSLVLVQRAISKKTNYVRDYFDNHGVIVGAEQDNQYVGKFSSYPGVNDCWGSITDEYEGSYHTTNSFETNQIYFADLREDILVYYHEEGVYAISGEGNAPLGFNLVYADFNYGAGCQSIHINDAIKLDMVTPSIGMNKEVITLGNYTPYTEDTGGVGEISVAATDHSGYCGGVTYGCYGFGNYSVIDQSKDYDCESGSYSELVSTEDIELMRNSWDSTGTLTLMDDFDVSTWNDYTAWWRTNVFSAPVDGTYEYPSFVPIDMLPHGSFVIDAVGNYFHSMITKDLKAFNKLNDIDPNVITKLAGDNIVFYPVGVL